MTPDEDRKVIYLYHTQLNYLSFGFITPLERSAASCKVLHGENQMFQTSATWNWHTNLQLILFSWSHFCYSTVVYVACLICFIQFIAGHSCLSNNIVNIPVPTLPAYTFFDCQVSTLCLIKLGSCLSSYRKKKKKKREKTNKNKTV